MKVQTQYKITSVATGKKTVSYVKVNKNKAVVVIPATITIKGEKYTVTGIEKKAFFKNKKLKKVTIGKNITKIGEKAFYGCKSLKKVTIQSKKLSKVGKKAFGNIAKNAKIEMPKGKQKAYKKLLG